MQIYIINRMTPLDLLLSHLVPQAEVLKGLCKGVRAPAWLLEGYITVKYPNLRGYFLDICLSIMQSFVLRQYRNPGQPEPKEPNTP